MMGQYAFFFDQSRCYSCHDCAVACKDWNGIEPGPEKWMTVYEWESGCYPELRTHSLAFPCAHCDDPACMKACSSKAIFKEEMFGAVLVDAEMCTGCKMCAKACPYGSPKFPDDKMGSKMSKCTLCIDRLTKNEMPLCVVSCPLRAFDFGAKEEMEEKYGICRQLDGMPAPEITKPNFIVREMQQKKQLVAYDSARALELMRHRGDLGTMYESTDEMTSFDSSEVQRGAFEMKYENSSDLLSKTHNNAG